MGVVLEASEIVKNYEISNGFYILEVFSPDIARSSAPGQFIMINLSHLHNDPLLPRAYSMARRTTETLVFIYRVVGRGTGLLSEKRPGDRVHVWGPLGNGFTITDRKAVLIGGGTGAAPLIDLSEEMSRRGMDHTLVCGGRTAGDLKFMDEFSDVVKYSAYTEDGSLGEKGFVTDYISNGNVGAEAAIYSCGPMGMLRRVSELAAEKGAECQISIETPMACGLGTCLGCAVPKRNSKGYYKACTDGPVFDSKEVVI
ncbi:MAG: dihydroorotate dehydrogenase electron transfer subunit [Candidatus Dadabacteria bacterium]|nr:dihydroorotate dehydrogenase electron transfer subunit [Candidatus Dadabacteria bacterium]